MPALLRSELFRLRRRRMTLILLLFIALVPIALYLLIYTATQAQIEAIRSGSLPRPQAGPAPSVAELEDLLRTLRPDRVPEMGLGLVAAIANILLIVLAGSVTGNEYGWGTIRTVLAHGGRRAAFLGAKLVALAAAAALVVAVGFASTAVGAFVVGLPAGHDLSVSADLPARLLGSVARAIYVQLPYIALATMVAVLARSAAAGIGFGLVLSFGESLVGQIAISINRDLRPLFDAGIARNVAAITRTSTTVQGVPPPAPPADLWIAALILALYVVAFVALAIHRIAKRDLTLA